MRRRVLQSQAGRASVLEAVNVWLLRVSGFLEHRLSPARNLPLIDVLLSFSLLQRFYRSGAPSRPKWGLEWE